MPCLVIFDVDGTLYKSETSYYPAVEDVLTKYGLPVPDKEFLDSMVGEPASSFQKWLGSYDCEKTGEELDAEIVQREVHYVRAKGELYEGVKETIVQLHAMNHILGLCSNGHTPYIDAIVDAFDLRRYLSFISLPATRSKTKSEALAEIIAEHPAEKAFMVGDRKHDIRAAKDNSIISIGAGWGFGEEEVNEADEIISRIDELIIIIGNNSK